MYVQYSLIAKLLNLHVFEMPTGLQKKLESCEKFAFKLHDVVNCMTTYNIIRQKNSSPMYGSNNHNSPLQTGANVAISQKNQIKNHDKKASKMKFGFLIFHLN
jgi:hypothetical protein